MKKRYYRTLLKLRQMFSAYYRDITLNNPLSIVMMDGGLCSQMMQYALGRYLVLKHNRRVKYDLNWFRKNGMDCEGREQRCFDLLRVFPNLDFDIAGRTETRLFKRHYYYNNQYTYNFNTDIYTLPPPLYLDGYYCSYHYFNPIREELLKDFDFSNLVLDEDNLQYLQKIADQPESVAVHIRRGDYVGIGRAFLTPEYYCNAAAYLRQRLGAIHLFLFSNDADWVRSQVLPLLPEGMPYTLVEGNDNNSGCYDLYLISRCRHQIASNSGFGIMGGFLNTNPDKIVILPHKYENNEGEKYYNSIQAFVQPYTVIL